MLYQRTFLHDHDHDRRRDFIRANHVETCFDFGVGSIFANEESLSLDDHVDSVLCICFEHLGRCETLCLLFDIAKYAELIHWAHA